MEWGMVVLSAGLLAFGPEGLRRGLVGFGRRAGWSDYVLGVAVMAPLLAAPFTLVALASAQAGAEPFGAGALLCAGTAQLLGLAGLAAVLRPARVDRRAATLDALALVLVSLEIAVLSAGTAAPAPAGVALLLTAGVYLGFLALRRPVGDPWAGPPPRGLRHGLLSLLFALFGSVALFGGAALLAAAAGPLVQQTGLSPTLAGAVIGGAALAFPGLLGVAGRVVWPGCYPAGQAIGATVLGLPLGLGLLLLMGRADLAALGPEAAALLAAGLICAGFFVVGRGLSRRDGLVLVMCCAGFITWLVLRVRGEAIG